MADAPRYELADFDPSDGHLHTGCTWAVGDTHPCDCAAHLFAIAQDQVLAKPAGCGCGAEVGEVHGNGCWWRGTIRG